MATWFTYILECADGSLYAGVTTDLERRVHEHNATKAGAAYTRARRPVELVFHHAFNDRSSAQKAEYAIKQLRRHDKLALVQGDADILESITPE